MFKTKWYLISWKLPRDTREAKAAARRFVKEARKNAPFFPDRRAAAVFVFSPESVSKLKELLPPDGEMRILEVTDKQMSRMECVWGKLRQP